MPRIDRLTTLINYFNLTVRPAPLSEATLVVMAAEDGAPPIVKCMVEAGRLAGVGPMAAVAGAVGQGFTLEVSADRRLSKPVTGALRRDEALSLTGGQ